MREVQLYIEADGTVRFVHDDTVALALVGQGRMATRRASHVEPVAPGPRKGWDIQWEIHLEPILSTKWNIGPYHSRREALEAEQFWLEVYLTYGVSMVSYHQMGKVIELKNQGWEILGYVGLQEAVGSPTVMRDPKGQLQMVDAAGNVAPLKEGTKWIDGRSSSVPPGSTETPDGTPTG